MIGIVGSRALLKYITESELGREPRDADFVATYEDAVANFSEFPIKYPINGGKYYVFRSDEHIVEVELAWPGSSAEELLRLIRSDHDGDWGFAPFKYAGVDIQYLLKMSHRYKKNSPHFLKTMRDIHKLRELGAVIRPEHQAFYERRMKETYDYAHPSLMQNKSDFFKGDGITYVYDHDSIHRAVARGPEPAYVAFQRDGAEVSCDRAKFDDLTFQEKLNSVIEEATVLALERSQIPHRGTVAPRRSYEIALMKVCTSITSGWWREWAWEHYYDALGGYDPHYAEQFWMAAEAGLVKLQKETP